MAGVSGSEFDSSLPRFGGYLLFPGDGVKPSDVRRLTDALRARNGDLPPLIAIDQEGGAVARLQEDVEPIPAMMALGAADDVELTRRAGEQVAFDLRRAGCTLDFAPVLDLSVDPGNAVIGTRSFGADPQRVAVHGAEFARGLTRGGVIPCYKHFPGHGATPIDSHEALPVVDADEATLRARDLVPFAAVAEDAPAIMSAHVLVPAFDTQHPATASRRIVHDLLRVELGFRGLFVTDCLEMGAVAGRGGVESAVDALNAGADLLLFSHDVELAAHTVAAIERAVGTGRISGERLQEAHGRVMRLRRATSAPIALDTFPPHPNVGREIGRRAIALVRGVPHADPLASIALSFGTANELLRHEAPALEAISLPLGPGESEITGALTRLDASRRRPLLLARRAHRHPSQTRAIAEIVRRYPDALVVSMLEPFDVPLFASARHVLAAHGDTAPSVGGLSDVLFGGTMPTARLAA
jgi:beta-N-acetylhexosaminidase